MLYINRIRPSTRLASRAGWLALALAILFVAHPTRAAIVLDTSSLQTATSSPITWSHTTGTGSDRILIVGVSIYNATNVSSVTYAGLPLTQIGSQNNGFGGFSRRIEMWALVAPPTGTANVIVTMASSTAVVAGAASYFGVDQVAPLGAFTAGGGFGFAPTITVASGPGQVVVDVVAVRNFSVSLTAGPGQTELWNASSGGGGTNVIGAGSMKPGAVSTTMSWAMGNWGFWVSGAVPMMPALYPHLPDAMVKMSTDPVSGYLIDDTYELTATTQIRSAGTLNNTTLAYDMQFENDGFNPDNFVITGNGSAATFIVQYFDGGGTDRTAAVTGGGYADILLAPGASTTWSVTITPLTGTTGGDSLVVAVTATSTGDPAQLDQVAAVGRSSSPTLNVSKSVDLASATPGQDVTYTVVATSAAGLDVAASIVVVDSIPPDTGYLVGSASFNPGTTPLTSTITYSDDDGASWGYVPGTGGCSAPSGYDYCVTQVRWTLFGTMAAARTFSLGFVVRVR